MRTSCVAARRACVMVDIIGSPRFDCWVTLARPEGVVARESDAGKRPSERLLVRTKLTGEEAVSQDELLDLARWCHRELINEHPDPWCLVCR